MAQFYNNICTFTIVKGDYLRDTNDNTKKIWNDALTNGFKDIIDATESDDKEKVYLVDTSVYHQLLEASREGKDIDPYGIPNVNFSLIERTDERWQKYKEQRLSRGFDNSELWNLDTTIVKFVLPRLKVFRSFECGHPVHIDTMEEWNEILDKMIKGFEYYLDDNLGEDKNLTRKENIVNHEKVISEGLDLFREYFSNLWN